MREGRRAGEERVKREAEGESGGEKGRIEKREKKGGKNQDRQDYIVKQTN